LVLLIVLLVIGIREQHNEADSARRGLDGYDRDNGCLRGNGARRHGPAAFSVTVGKHQLPTVFVPA
jgi:hypothetical protein